MSDSSSSISYNPIRTALLTLQNDRKFWSVTSLVSSIALAIIASGLFFTTHHVLVPTSLLACSAALATLVIIYIGQTMLQKLKSNDLERQQLHNRYADLLHVDSNVLTNVLNSIHQLKAGRYATDDGLEVVRYAKQKTKLIIKKTEEGSTITTKTPFSKGAAKQACIQVRIDSNSKVIRELVKLKITYSNANKEEIAHEFTILKQLSEKTSNYILQASNIKNKSLSPTHMQTTFMTDYCNQLTYNRYFEAHPNASAYERLQVVSDGLKGLAVLHEFECLHLDLHWNNLFMHDGRGKLGDFGSSRPLHLLRKTEYLAQMFAKDSCWNGNYCMLAPEIYTEIYGIKIFEEKKIAKSNSFQHLPITLKADIWSFSVLISEITPKTPENVNIDHHCYTNAHPRKANAMQIAGIIQHQIDDIVEPQDKHSLYHLVWRMSHKTPENRPDALECANFIDTWLTNNPA